ncbi:hypothetical protein H5410_001348 [Solanum commersonii]|uniref:Uncharacterized protein n=1 Tax=Solanum commersonii TaxID=4109 RepID=A0A9J6AZV7_SOLCO|nr:hypothetical protein H5410_001348 [Solanum commersonii]
MGPTLKELSLRNVSNVGDEGLFEIAHGCHMLKKLDLFQWLMNRDIAKNCLNLNSLSINDCSYIGNESLKIVGEYCPNLKHIRLKIVHSLGIKELVKFEELNINDISLDIISHYGTALTHLSFVDLQRVEQRDYGLVACVKALVSLQSIQLEECHLITQARLYGILLNYGNTTIDVLRRLCHKLTHLELNGLLRIIDEGLLSFVQRCKSNLMVMNLSGYFTDATLVEIANSCLLLTKLDVSKCYSCDDLAMSGSYAFASFYDSNISKFNFKISYYNFWHCPIFATKKTFLFTKLNKEENLIGYNSLNTSNSTI